MTNDRSNDEGPEQSIERRDILRAAGVIGLGTALTSVVAPSSMAAMRASVLSTSCTLTAAQIQGPFYRDLDLVRSDITEGVPGVPLYMYIRVLDEDGCTPLPGAEVDVWHTESLGTYSNFASQGTAGETWLRGVQFAGSDGIARFKTIYPGWYPGRTTHLHVKINPDQTSELTTQLYFNDTLTSRIYSFPPYDLRGPKDTSNAQDSYFRSELVMGTIAAPNLAFTSIMVIAGITIVVDWP